LNDPPAETGRHEKDPRGGHSHDRSVVEPVKPLSLIQRAVKQDPGNGAYLDSLGWIYFKQNKLVDAEATLRMAEERESHDATIHSHLGDVYAKTGRQDKAAAEWEKSLVEWKRALPADVENDKIAEIEKKLSQSKHRVAQQTGTTPSNPNDKP